ncbi:MAG: orotidine-5'-phosphate decarboxylase [Veillonellales bacterium]
MNDQRLIVALDVSDLAKVKQIVAALGDSVSYYKVGMELYYSVGREALDFLRRQDKQVFLDLKFFDIPHTVARSAAALTGLGISLLTVHASGGPSMMREAAQAVAEQARNRGIVRPKLVAVTVLTSISEKEWSILGYGKNTAEQVIHLARLAQQSGMDGVVASPREAAEIRKACGRDFLIVTPGIRPQGAGLNDQSRTATPAGALQNGADYLVVGRPIIAAADAKLAAENILREMEGVK